MQASSFRYAERNPQKNAIRREIEMNASLSSKITATRKLAGLVLLPLLAGLVAVSLPADSGASGQGTSSASQGTTTKKAPAAARPAYDRTLLHPALLKEKAPDEYKVKFTTTRGEFTVTVTRAWAPLGADRFWNLVKHHFYDDASVFRVAPGFVAQFGISSYPPVSAAWHRTEIKDDPVTQSNKKGFITFATAGANTRTTQVFINLKDNSPLDKTGFAPFGVVEGDGMNVVEMFYDQYGDRSGIDQDQIEKQGKSYLDKGYPKLDVIKTVVITEPAQPTPAAKPATTTKKPQ
jgi:peptidyl-prolyl cis-trans isomerase A (cyclophilin A)